MTHYEAGFDAGERDAYKDRQNGIRRTQSTDPSGGEYQRGYWEAYRPRNLAWALKKPPQAWWQERESETA